MSLNININILIHASIYELVYVTLSVISLFYPESCLKIRHNLYPALPDHIFKFSYLIDL